LTELDITLPSSEEEWFAESGEIWWDLKISNDIPPTPRFLEAFRQLFERSTDSNRRYSDFGGYVLISAILSAIMDAHRVSRIPTLAGTIDFRRFDIPLDNWQRLWLANPKSRSAGPSSPFGAMAFNASAIYRAASIRRVKDYSRYYPTDYFRAHFASIKSTLINLNDVKTCSGTILQMLHKRQFSRSPESNRALIASGLSIQVMVTLGLRLLAQTASLTWSPDHPLANFEVGSSLPDTHIYI